MTLQERRFAPGRTSRTRRRGAAYIFFLGSAMLVAIIGLSALTVARVKLRAAEGLNDRSATQNCAQAAVEQALLAIHHDAQWRDRIAHNTWTAPQAIGQGTLSWKLVDEVNGSLTTDRNAPVRVHGKGACGEAVWIYSAAVQAPPETAPNNVLVNGDMEAGVAQWTQTGGCVLQVNTTSKHGGTASLGVTSRNAGSAAAQALPSLTAGVGCRASVWVQMTGAPETVWFGLRVQTGAGPQYLEFARTSVGTSWTQLGGTIDLSTVTSLTSATCVVGTDGIGEFNVDDALLITSPSVIGVIPGTWRREAQ